jgi:hypothetical protein
MLRQAQSQGVKDPSAGTMVRVLWFAGYLTIALGALLPTFLLPEAWSILHSGHRYLLDVPIMLPKRGDFGVQKRTGELSWRQELLPLHLSQFENLDIHTPQFKVDQKVRDISPSIPAWPAKWRIEITHLLRHNKLLLYGGKHLLGSVSPLATITYILQESVVVSYNQ